jgi:hypothetical protein
VTVSKLPALVVVLSNTLLRHASERRPHSSAALTAVALDTEYDFLLSGSSDGSLCLSDASAGERIASLLPQHPAQGETKVSA